MWNLLPEPFERVSPGFGKDKGSKGTTPTPDDMSYYTNATYGQSVIPVPETIGTNQGIVDNYRAFYNQDTTTEPKTITRRESSEEEKGFF